MSFFDDASLAFLPSGGAGKDTKAYSIKPTDGSGDFTFSRGSNLSATRIGPTGLIEKGRENLLLRSNEFDTTWATIDSNVTSSQSGYDGSSDAWLLSKTGASGRITQTKSISGIFTFSVYVKKGTTDWVLLYKTGTGEGGRYFDLTNGVTGSSIATAPIDSKIEDVGNGWYRCSIVGNSATAVVAYVADSNGSQSGTSGSIYIQDAQAEIGLAATEVITTGATTGKAGLLEDEPRFDYSGGATCPSLLLEPSRTNLIGYSEYFEGTDWVVQAGITLTPNTTETLSPEGLNNAYKVVSTDATKGFYFGGLNVTNAAVRTIYLKGSVGGETIVLKDPSGFGTPSTKTLSTDWQRFEMATTNDGNSYQGLFIDDISVGTIYAYGAQLEAGSYPTSYIPNHSGTGSVTRGLDVCEGAGDASTFNSTEGVLYAEISALEDLGTARRYISLSDGSSSNDLRLYFNNSVGTIAALSKVGGVTQFSMFGSGYDLTEVHKIAVKYKVNDFALWIDGVEVDTDSSGSVNAANTFNELAFNGNSLPFFGKAKQVLVFNTALSDADLTTLTT